MVIATLLHGARAHLAQHGDRQVLQALAHAALVVLRPRLSEKQAVQVAYPSSLMALMAKGQYTAQIPQLAQVRVALLGFLGAVGSSTTTVHSPRQKLQSIV